MSRPWMPLYISDYLADTGHLSASEHGAYLLLIMHYWQTGGLPDDERRLARIARMSESEWSLARPTVRAFFREGWFHPRIDGELQEAARLAEAGRKGGKASAEARRTGRQSRPKGDDPGDDEAEGQRSGKHKGNDPPTIGQAPQPHPQLDDGGGVARARDSAQNSEEAFEITGQIGVICGFADARDWPLGWNRAPEVVQNFINWGWSRDVMLAEARAVMAGKRDGPPETMNYFEKPFAKAHARRNAKPPVVAVIEPTRVTVNGHQDRSGNSLLGALDRVERSLGDPRDKDDLLRISKG